jgi:hypothetical protein
MEYSEQAIYELQSILREKVGDDRLPVIKKAMDVEDFLYRDALYKSGLDLTGNVWESSSAVNTYIESVENVKKLIKAKEDFGKIFQIADSRQFYLQLTSPRTTANKKKVSRAFEQFLHEIRMWKEPPLGKKKKRSHETNNPRPLPRESRRQQTRQLPFLLLSHRYLLLRNLCFLKQLLRRLIFPQ